MMKNFWNAIGDFFTATFEFMPLIGNKINYVYILVIFLFLVIWVVKMYNHRKNGEEHRSL
ncbi:MAG: DUF6341 family protein [Flavobacteriales bacterium]|jgi:hypothetical protein|tara:strand:- start:580 stop:759 length:180 start_codon:yes stop_codon:yes gene_type:complete